MSKLSLTSILFGAGTVVAVATGYLLYQLDRSSPGQAITPLVSQNIDQASGEAASADASTKQTPAVEEDQNQSQSDQASDTQAQDSAKETEIASLQVEVKEPTISLLRVEPDGSVVIAGTGPKNSIISLLNGTQVIGETKSLGQGDYTLVLDTPLQSGQHMLAGL